MQWFMTKLWNYDLMLGQKCVCYYYYYYLNVTMLRSGLCYRKSICLSVWNVRVPYSGSWTFRNISSPLCTLAIFWRLCKILRRSSHGNPSLGDVKRKRGSKIVVDLSKAISHKRYKIQPRVQLMTKGNDIWGIHLCNFQWPWPIRNPDFKVIWVFCRQ